MRTLLLFAVILEKRVDAQGVVSGSVPATGPYDGTAGNGQVITSYQYQDVIGGGAVIDLGAGG